MGRLSLATRPRSTTLPWPLAAQVPQRARRSARSARLAHGPHQPLERTLQSTCYWKMLKLNTMKPMESQVTRRTQ